MRKVYLILVVIAIVALVLYLTRPRQVSHPRADEFVDTYVDLALLHEYGDTSGTRFTEQRDSVLAAHGFTDSSLIALKDELDQDPVLIANVWDDIEHKLRDLKDEYSPLGQQDPDSVLTSDKGFKVPPPKKDTAGATK